MKRLLLCTIAILSISLVADAQPWLFPGRKKARKDTSSVKREVKDSVAVAAQDSVRIDGIAIEEVFVPDIPEIIKVSLLLPIKSKSEKPSSNFIEYYGGALMAVRQMGLEGTRIELSVFDTEDALLLSDWESIGGSDIVIGPVKSNEIVNALVHEPHLHIVSPIEPKAEALADSMSVIQAPSSWMSQTRDMVKWLAEDTMLGDNVIILKDEGEAGTSEKTSFLMTCLAASGLNYSIVNDSAVNAETLTGRTRFVVASDRDVFVCSAINSIAALSNRCDVVLYTTSAVRSLEGIKSTSLFNANARMTASYFIDYESAAIKSFVLDYRALFHHEPTSFAFSGYDTMTYFVSMCRKYGRKWYSQISNEYWKGLQADFRFDASDKAGKVNQAVRRLVYTPDFDIIAVTE